MELFITWRKIDLKKSRMGPHISVDTNLLFILTCFPYFFFQESKPGPGPNNAQIEEIAKVKFHSKSEIDFSRFFSPHYFDFYSCFLLKF